MSMKKQTDKHAFFTIDVERFADTECVYNSGQPVERTMLDGLDRYIEILDKYDIKATLFVLSDLADEVKDKLKSYIKKGHKIALHGKSHTPPRFITNEQFEEQIFEAKEKVEHMFNVPIIGYRAPCFSMDRDKLDILQKLKFGYDASKMNFSAARHTERMNMDGFEQLGSEVYKKGDFYEFGVSTQNVIGKQFPVSGGGYIRLSNWLFASFVLKKYLKSHDNYVFYSHPFELSNEKTPKLKKLKLYDRFYLKFGKLTYPCKIEYIIRKLKKYGYKFLTFEDVIKA